MYSSLAKDSKVSMKRATTSWMLVLAGVLVLTLAAGCGGGDKETAGDEGVVVASVGDNEITSDYYENRLAKLETVELPRKDGVTLDMAADEGKKAFLEVLINKELMVLKAKQLGYDRDPMVAGARESMIEYEAGVLMFNEMALSVGNEISEEYLQDFYSKLGTEYRCLYLITNFEEDAEKARDEARAGADWEDITAKYHDGRPSPNGAFRVSIPYGQYSPYFEDEVFATELGGITNPIKTGSGYWVLRVAEILNNPKPDLEAAKAQILDVTRNRKIGAQRESFRDQVMEENEFVINEDALWAVYEGLPPEGLMDPETKQPYARDRLNPLDIRAEDMGLVLYSHRDRDGGLVEKTVAAYKEFFDQLGVFQRPKRDEMLGGLRLKLMEEVVKGLMNVEADRRGYYDRPEVVNKVDLKIEEIMVEKLFNEVVSIDDKVTTEDLEAFWAVHSVEYKMPESRSGNYIQCASREAADRAYQALSEGKPWREVLAKYGNNTENKRNAGMSGSLRADSKSPAAPALFALGQEGDLSQPSSTSSGDYVVVQLTKIEPAHDYTMNEVSEALGGRIKKARKDTAFKNLLEKWSQEFPVVIHEDKLASLKSYEELTAVTVPENLVPRN